MKSGSNYRIVDQQDTIWNAADHVSNMRVTQVEHERPVSQRANLTRYLTLPFHSLPLAETFARRTSGGRPLGSRKPSCAAAVSYRALPSGPTSRGKPQKIALHCGRYAPTLLCCLADPDFQDSSRRFRTHAGARSANAATQCGDSPGQRHVHRAFAEQRRGCLANEGTSFFDQLPGQCDCRTRL